MMDINEILRLQEVRAGKPYFSPANIMSVEKHWYGRPFTMEPLPMGEMLGVTISAPEQPVRKRQYTVQSAEGASVMGTGSAPTSGIYTGVEDHCG